MGTNYTSSEPIEASEEYEISFKGNGGEYFTIVIVNWLLTVITIGLYYPWAKARKLQYLYSATEFNKIPFAFHGTGREMFKGFIKAIIILTIIYGIYFYLIILKMILIASIVLLCSFVCLLPLAIHGSYRYRMSRTSWGGIRMGYRGDRKILFGIYLKGVILTIVTLGIYGAWFVMNLRNYLLNNVRLGSLKFAYNGKGGDYFLLNLKGYLLTILTFGIYFFWWQKDIMQYYINNLSLVDEQNNRKISLTNLATGGKIAGLLITNALLFIFTLGLAYPWIVCRSLNFIFSNVAFSGDIKMSSITQTEVDYNDATGEDLNDILDFGFVI